MQRTIKIQLNGPSFFTDSKVIGKAILISLKKWLWSIVDVCIMVFDIVGAYSHFTADALITYMRAISHSNKISSNKKWIPTFVTCAECAIKQCI